MWKDALDRSIGWHRNEEEEEDYDFEGFQNSLS